jgi:hypothetical protein
MRDTDCNEKCHIRSGTDVHVNLFCSINYNIYYLLYAINWHIIFVCSDIGCN